MAYIRGAEKRKRSVSKIDRFSDYVIDSPSHGHFHTRPFVQRLIIGQPFSIKHEITPLKREGNGAVRILHAPSSPEGKGTPRIREAIDSLIQRGHAVDYVEITGMPNEQVLEELNSCDFVIEQAYSDMPMVMFATEAAFYGKPAVVGGYYAEQIRDDIDGSFIPPCIFCHPDDIEQSIEKLVVDKKFRSELGMKAKRFAEENFTPRKVAEKFLQLIDNSVPAEWLYDPSKIRYVHGMGLSEIRAKRIVAAVLRLGGRKALQLDDKPELQNLIMNFASSLHSYNLSSYERQSSITEHSENN
jgi:hypothetical protein